VARQTESFRQCVRNAIGQTPLDPGDDLGM
jgi:hypothetical protein